MNPHRYLKAICLFALTVLLFNGCKKFDFPPVKKCKIVETTDLLITYDEWGNPKSAVYKVDPDDTGRPGFYFLYNDKHQLIEYGGGNQHILTLNPAGQAIKDTFIMNYAGQDDRYAIEISYDHLGRVIKTTSEFYHSAAREVPVPHEISTEEFKYDSWGNLIVLGYDANEMPIIREYDNNTNLFRTHPVFMFIHRNYSINNLVPNEFIYNFNAAGLPDKYEGVFLQVEDQRNIIYDCMKNGGK